MSEDTTVRIERVIDAPPATVFRVWTTKDAMEEWYRDGEDSVANVVELDVRKGGGYKIVWGSRSGPTYTERGEYLEVDPPHRLVMTETLEGPENGGWANTRVTVLFEEEAGKTRLILVHENLPSKEHAEGARGGWPGFIDCVERIALRG